MADEKPTIHIDADWKRQAQDEKRKLAEEAQKKAAAPAAPSGSAADTAAAPGPRAGPAGRGRREIPQPGFGALVQSMVTQILFYLGDLHQSGGESAVNLDMAKYQIDTLGVLEEKTVNNLTPEEKQMLDAALYEVRMRYVQVAAQYV